MNTYNSLGHYYQHMLLQQLLSKKAILHPENHRSKQERGGWIEGVGYDDASQLNAHHYHYLSHSMDTHVLEKETKDCLETLVQWTKVRAKQITDQELGEICIRIIWYDAHPERMTLGYHVDSDFLTVPLYDSTRSTMAEPFFGQLAEDIGYYKAKNHGFVVKTVPRLYVVAFVQLPMDTILPNGQRYGDRVRELTARAGHNNSRVY